MNITIPAGTTFFATETGHYNFHYPNKEKPFRSPESIQGEVLCWKTPKNWQAIYIGTSTAKRYNQKYPVIWVKEATCQKEAQRMP